MTQNTRLYVVTDAETKTRRLIDAASQAAAIRHMAQRFTATPASPRDVADCYAAGIRVEKAGAPVAPIVDANETALRT